MSDSKDLVNHALWSLVGTCFVFIVISLAYLILLWSAFIHSSICCLFFLLIQSAFCLNSLPLDVFYSTLLSVVTETLPNSNNFSIQTYPRDVLVWFPQLCIRRYFHT